MYYSDIVEFDIANGEGVRTSLFVSGCTNKCPGCFNPQTWDFNYGQKFTDDTIRKIIESLAPDYIKGLSLLGGDPFHPNNQSEVLRLVREVKKIYPNKDIWCWTGYYLKTELTSGGIGYTEDTPELLDLIDVLVDGRFIQELYSPHLEWKGSSNQTVYRLMDTRKMFN